MYRVGDLTSIIDGYDIVFISANSTIKKDGSLVMGRGIALDIRERYPNIPSIYGKIISLTCGSGGVYGLLHSTHAGKIGLLQTKTDFRRPSGISLVRYSVGMLYVYAKSYPERRIAINFPGVGCGGLRVTDVKPILDRLPVNVDIWSYDGR